MIQRMLRSITGHYHLAGQTPGEFQKMKVSGMTFHIYSFHAEGLGHVSAMTASGFFGLMKMDTLIINPSQVDMPLFSYDRIHAMGNDTLYLELFDTLLGETDLSGLTRVKEEASALPDHDPGKAWYEHLVLPQSTFKKGKSNHRQSFDAAAEHFLSAYLAAAQNAAPCGEDEKLEKASAYVEGLLTNGGPSTNVFKKALGEKKTARLFRTVLFGTCR